MLTVILATVPNSNAINTGEWWIIVFTALTATFTGLAVMIAWQGHQDRRADTGRAHPIIIGAARASAGNFRPNVGVDWDAEPNQWGQLRVFELYVFNRSNIPQQLTFLDIHVWRGKDFYLFDCSERVDVPRHEGGNCPLRVANYRWLNLRDGEAQQLSETEGYKGHAIYLKAATLSGHTVRYFGIAEFRTYRGSFI